MKYQVFTAVEVIEADTRLEAIEKFCDGYVIILLEELVDEGPIQKRGHEFRRRLLGAQEVGRVGTCLSYVEGHKSWERHERSDDCAYWKESR